MITVGFAKSLSCSTAQPAARDDGTNPQNFSEANPGLHSGFLTAPPLPIKVSKSTMMGAAILMTEHRWSSSVCHKREPSHGPP